MEKSTERLVCIGAVMVMLLTPAVLGNVTEQDKLDD